MNVTATVEPRGMAVFAVLALVLTCAPASAAAQQDIVFTTLGIDLWPDYDRPGVLVIYRGTLAPGVSLPTTLEFRIPAAAGAPAALAERQADGQLINVPFERRVDGDVAVILASISRPIVQMEYYDPAIERDETTRRFVFNWPGDFEVGDLSVSVQQPDLARNLVTEPAAASRAPGADGLMYHTVGLGAVAAGESAAVRVSYEKTSDQLTQETLPAPEPAATPGTATPATPGSDSEVVLIVTVILAVAAIAAVAVIAMRARGGASDTGGATAGAASGRVRSPRGAARGGGGSARFCTQCGAGAGPDDRFCHNCGAGLH